LLILNDGHSVITMCVSIMVPANQHEITKPDRWGLTYMMTQ